MSDQEQKSSPPPSSPQIQRRSFLKMVLAGLAASIPVAAGLLKPSSASAYVPCSLQLCTKVGNYGDCVDHVQIDYELWACYDARGYGFCGYEARNVRAVGCC